MKKIARYLQSITIVAVLFLITSFKPAPDAGKFLFVRVFEAINTMYPSQILVTDGNTILKTVEIQPFRPKNLESNVITIAKTLSDIKDQGYTLTSSHSAATELVIQSEYVFEKGK